LKGFPDAIETVFPEAQIQLCLVHLMRASLNYVNWKERKLVAANLKQIYRAATVEQAEAALAEFAERWDGKYPTISRMWRRHWERVTPLFEYPAQIRRVIYTTNAVESLHMTQRKVTKNRGSFPSEEAALKLLYLALRNVAQKWQSVQHWKAALSHFSLLWQDRIEAAAE
jgi:putative transposase